MSASRAKSSKRSVAARKKPAAKPRTRARPPAHSSPRHGTEAHMTLDWFRLLARIRGAWLQHTWSNEGLSDGHGAVTHVEFRNILDAYDSVERQLTWTREQPEVQAWRREQSRLEETLGAVEESRFLEMAHLFGLAKEEVRLLRLAFAVGMEPSLSRVCAYLQDNSARPYLTDELANRLLELPATHVWGPELNVFRWGLISHREMALGEPVALVCDQQVRQRLLGLTAIDGPLLGRATLVRARASTLPEWPTESVAAWVDHAFREDRQRAIRIVVIAPRGAGKQNFARAVARRIGLPIMAVNFDGTHEAEWPDLFLHAQRQAFLDGAAPVWSGELPLRRFWPSVPVTFPLQFVLAEPGVVPQPSDDAIDLNVTLAMPVASTRERLWKDASEKTGQWPADSVRALSVQHAVWPGDIDRTINLGATSAEAAARSLREHARARFENLAQILECPFRFDDLVLPEGIKLALKSIIFEAEHRESFWERDEPSRLFPQGRGLVTMFTGPPGTGKTMAAQVIAASLGRDLCRVNVAQLVSKWVGETAKNYERVIRIAAENNVVILFDEAEAIFSRRSLETNDALDKAANTDTAFLLQEIESFPGIAILATNLKSKIDSAFLRRIRYLIEFPKPDVAMKRTLWAKLIAGLAGDQRAKHLARALESLGGAVDATGAQIKYAVLAAIFAAQAENSPLEARHLLIGLDRELLKEGRIIGARERAQILELQ